VRILSTAQSLVIVAIALALPATREPDRFAAPHQFTSAFVASRSDVSDSLRAAPALSDDSTDDDDLNPERTVAVREPATSLPQDRAAVRRLPPSAEPRIDGQLAGKRLAPRAPPHSVSPSH